MGAWGVGIFQNDDAADWIWELEESKGHELLETTFETINQAQYREAPDSSCALAAAEVVSALIGKPMANIPEEVTNWVSSNPIKVNSKLLSAANAAVDHILVDSELKELWEETDDYSHWQSILKNLMGRLTNAP